MTDFTVLYDEFVLCVVLCCLIIGYIIKTALDFIPNKYIPTILAIIGAVCNGFFSGWSIETVIYGAMMGLCSTGLHQAFTRFIEKGSEE